MSSVQDVIRSQRCSATHRRSCFVSVAQLCCVSPLEAKLDSQKGVPSGGSSIKIFSGCFLGERERERERGRRLTGLSDSSLILFKREMRRL